MSLALTLGNALSGLDTAQRALGATAHNVANANTEGYVRKVPGQAARVVDGRGAGVEATELTRIVDAFLVAELRDQGAVLGRAEALDRYHGRAQALFGAPGEERDLAAGLGRLSAALEAFANEPETTALATGVVAAASGLAREVGGFADGVQRLRADADAEIAREVEAANAEIRALHGLNREIARLAALGQDGAELRDRRDALLKSLGERLDVTTYALDHGAVAVATKGGVVLLDGAPRTLVYDPAVAVAAAATFGPISAFADDQVDPATGAPYDPGAGVELVSGGVRATLTPEFEADAVPDDEQAIATLLRGGRIKGLLDARDRVLPALDDQVQELAEGLRFALNAAHNAGAAQPPPSTLAGSRTDLASFAGNGSGQATLAVVGADGATVATVAVDLAAAPDAASLAAQIDAGLGALGSATITADGGLEIALADPTQGLAVDEGTSAVAVTDAAGRTREYGFSHYFGLNDLFVADGARPSDMAVRADIAADPGRLAAARLDVDPGPPAAATLGGAGDNRGAQALAAAMTEARGFAARGGLPAQSATLAGYAADITAAAAAAADHARDALGRDRAMALDLEFRAAAVSGVNLDEELSRLVLYQRSYTASARVIAITDELFDELTSLVR